VAIAVRGNAGETLDYGITSGGGAFSPDAGGIAVPGSGSGTIYTVYGAPDAVDTYAHTVRVTNSQGNSVETDFTTLVVYDVTDAGMAVQFAPAILSLAGRRDGTDVIFEAEVADDGEHGDLTYLWGWDGESGFVDNTTNPVVLTNYDETETGTMSLTVTDADGLSTTVSFELVAGQFPDNPIIDDDPGGQPDYVDAYVANAGPNFAFFNDGAGYFTYSGQGMGTANSYGVDLGDMDLDGDLDAFVSNAGPNRLWSNNGNGVFTVGGYLGSSLTTVASALGDIDSDGDLDVFNANLGPNQILLNDGIGNLTLGPMPSGPASNSFDVELADLDGDGDLDAFEVTQAQYNRVWRNDGAGNFIADAAIIGPALPCHGVDLGDVDGDGDIDAFVAIASSQPNRVYLNDGSGTFVDSGQILGNFPSEQVVLADIDDNGTLDAVVANMSAPDIVWINDGGGGFTLLQQLQVSSSYDLDIGDVNGDGILDAVFAVVGARNKVWFGNGDGTFTQGTDMYGPAGTNRGIALGVLR
jgi:hypothetical protein